MVCRDDVAIYELHRGIWLASSVDFGTPVSSDTETWGRIAAENALSDIYATGGDPLYALSILGWPADLEEDDAGRLLAAAVDTLNEAETALLGGHTIVSDVPILGFAVTGIVDPGQTILVSAAKPHQWLVVTKPLGTGVIVGGIKAGAVGETAIEVAHRVMSGSNRDSSRLARGVGVRAGTDVTGYGLVGHLRNILLASGCAAVINPPADLFIAEASALLADECLVPNSTERNYFAVSTNVSWGDLGMVERLLLCDPQTSGGLLLCIDPGIAEEFLARCADHRQFAAIIGRVVDGPAGYISIERGGALHGAPS